MHKIFGFIFTVFMPTVAFAQQAQPDSTWRTIAIEFLILAPLAALAIYLKRKQSRKITINDKPIIFASSPQPIASHTTAQIITCSNQRYLLIQNKTGHLALTPILEETKTTPITLS
jgi:hypothetical protein